MTTRRLVKARTFPVSVERAYDIVLTTPLPEIFGRRYFAIAPIKQVTGQDDEWGVSVGQSRTIHLSDGGTMQETLTVLDSPRRFGYTMSNITGMMKPLVSAADGTWTFDAAGTGVRVTWTWEVTPTSVGRAAMPVFARLWSGYARQAMEEIERIVVR